MVNAAFRTLGRVVVRYRWVIVVLWLVGTGIAVKSLPSLASQVNNNNSAFLPASAPSNRAADLAEPLVGPGNQSPVPVVITAKSGRLSPDDLSAVQAIATKLGDVATVDRVQFAGLSPDGRAAQIFVLSRNSPSDIPADKTLIEQMQAAVNSVNVPHDIDVHFAGAVATQVANQAQSERSGKETQTLSILFIIVLLFLIFRSVLAPILTLLPAALVLQLSQSLIGGLGAHGLKISSVTQLLLIVLVLGAGTDYGLFLVFRVREELQTGRPTAEAVSTAVERVGESITGSASTVILALLSLGLASFGLYKDLGPPLAIGIAVMLLAGLTLMPALLAIFGRAVFWPSKLEGRAVHEGLWGRTAARLVQRPALALMIGIVIFGALASAVAGYKSAGFGGALTAPSGSDAAAGNAALLAHFPQASENPTNVIMRFPEPVWTNADSLAKATQLLEHTGQFTGISGPLNPSGTALTPAQLVALYEQLGPPQLLPTVQPPGSPIPPEIYNSYRATARFISEDGRTVQWQAGLVAGDPATTKAIDAVPAIRADVERVAKEVGATASGVAGQAPALSDVSATSNADLLHIVPIAVLVIGIVLGLVLRSLVAPIYLLVSVVISYLASLGLAVIVFIELGGQSGIIFILPFLMFIFLLALGEDYNILVMSRIREEAAHIELREAVVRAVGATGSTVTSAGLVLAGTFAVFAITATSSPGGSGIVVVGFGLAVGVLLDTFVVRTILVPSTVALLGRWNWWPSAMSRREHAAEGRRSSPAAVGGPEVAWEELARAPATDS
jgi:putative drug exporter of the RND superfamily